MSLSKYIIEEGVRSGWVVSHIDKWDDTEVYGGSEDFAGALRILDSGANVIDSAAGFMSLELEKLSSESLQGFRRDDGSYKRLDHIKFLRTMTGMGLKEAKDLSDIAHNAATALIQQSSDDDGGTLNNMW